MGSCFSRCWCSCCTFDIIRRFLLSPHTPNVHLYQFKSSTDSFDNSPSSRYTHCRKLSDNSTCNIVTFSDQSERVTSFTDDVSFVDSSSFHHRQTISSQVSEPTTTKYPKSVFSSSPASVTFNLKNQSSSFTRGIKFWALTGSFKKCYLGSTSRQRKCKLNDHCTLHHGYHVSKSSHCSTIDSNNQSFNCSSSCPSQVVASTSSSSSASSSHHVVPASSTHHQMCHCICDTVDSRSSSIVSLCDNRSPKCHSRNKLYPFKCSYDKQHPIQCHMFHDKQLDTVSSATASSITHETNKFTANQHIESSKINTRHVDNGKIKITTNNDIDVPISIINVPPVCMTPCITHLTSTHPESSRQMTQDEANRSKSALIKRKELHLKSNSKQLSGSNISLHTSLLHYCQLVGKSFHSTRHSETSESLGNLCHDDGTSTSQSITCDTNNSDQCKYYSTDDKGNNSIDETLQIIEANKEQVLLDNTLHQVPKASGGYVDNVETCNIVQDAPSTGSERKKYSPRQVNTTLSSSSATATATNVSLMREKRNTCNHLHDDDDDDDDDASITREGENYPHENDAKKSDVISSSSISSRFSSRMLAFLRTPSDQVNNNKVTSDTHFIDQCDCGDNLHSSVHSCSNNRLSCQVTHSSYDEANASTFRSRISSLLRVKSYSTDVKLNNNNESNASSKCKVNFIGKKNLLTPFAHKVSSDRQLIEESSFTKDVDCTLEFENLIYDFDIPEPTDAILELQSPESLTHDSFTFDSLRDIDSPHQRDNFIQSTPQMHREWVQFNENLPQSYNHHAGYGESTNHQSDKKGARSKTHHHHQQQQHSKQTKINGSASNSLVTAGFNGYVDDCMKFHLPCKDGDDSFDTPLCVTDTRDNKENKHLSLHNSQTNDQVNKFNNSRQMRDEMKASTATLIDDSSDALCFNNNRRGKLSHGKSKKCNRNSFPLMDPLLSQDLDETYALAVTSRRKKTNDETVGQTLISNNIISPVDGTVMNSGGILKQINDASVDGAQIIATNTAVLLNREDPHVTLGHQLPAAINVDTCDCNLLVTNCTHKSKVNSSRVNNITSDDSPSKSSMKSCDDPTTNLTQGGADVSSIASVDAIDLEWDDYDQTNVQLEDEEVIT